MPPLPTRFSIEPGKITLYLLNVKHVRGASKARFFAGWGFDAARPDEFAAALLDHPHRSVLVEVRADQWGDRFIYEGSLQAPRGHTPRVRTVWIVRHEQSAAHLLTAYPC